MSHVNLKIKLIQILVRWSAASIYMKPPRCFLIPMGSDPIKQMEKEYVHLHLSMLMMEVSTIA